MYVPLESVMNGSLDHRSGAQIIGRRQGGARRAKGRSMRNYHGKNKPHVKGSCRKLKELGKTKRFNRRQRNLMWAEYGRHCKEDISCYVCGKTEEEADLKVCSGCLTAVYCSHECQEQDKDHYQE